VADAKLNPQQRRHLHDSLAHLDRQLSAIEALLLLETDAGLFPRYADDLFPQERAQHTASVERARTALRRAMAEHTIEPEAARTGARQAIQSQWSLAEIGLEELGARSMRGYGPLEADTAQALERLAAELQAALPGRRAAALPGGPARAEALAAALAEATPAALEAMAEALAEAAIAGRGNDELPLVAGDALARVAREAAAQLAGRGGEANPWPPLDINGIAWRLDKPRLAGLGRNYLLGRFRRQLQPLEAQVRAALRAYGPRLGN